MCFLLRFNNCCFFNKNCDSPNYNINASSLVSYFNWETDIKEILCVFLPIGFLFSLYCYECVLFITQTQKLFLFACGWGEPVIPGMLHNLLFVIYMIRVVSLLPEIEDGKGYKGTFDFLDPCKSRESISISFIGLAAVCPYQPVTHNSECSWMLSETLSLSSSIIFAFSIWVV